MMKRTPLSLLGLYQPSWETKKKGYDMKSQSIIVFYKKGFKRIFLFEADNIDDMFQALEYDAFKDKKGRAYFLVDGVEIKLTE